MHVYEVHPRKDKRGVDLISAVLPFGRLWYGEPDAINNAVDYAKFYSRSHDALIRVYDVSRNVIERHAVAPIILTGSSKTYTTARKHLPHYLRYLGHAVVVKSIANIEYLIVNRFGGRVQHRDNRTRDVQLRLVARVGFSWFRPPRYGTMRGRIVGEAVVTLATFENSFRLPFASLTRTR